MRDRILRVIDSRDAFDQSAAHRAPAKFCIRCADRRRAMMDRAIMRAESIRHRANPHESRAFHACDAMGVTRAMRGGMRCLNATREKFCRAEIAGVRSARKGKPREEFSRAAHRPKMLAGLPLSFPSPGSSPAMGRG